MVDPNIFLEISENFEPSIIQNKIGSNFLVQLAGQISENNIQEFLIGSQIEKLGRIFQKLDPNSRNFSDFFVGRIKPRGSQPFSSADQLLPLELFACPQATPKSTPC